MANNAAAISSIVNDVSNNAAGVSNNAASISSNDAEILSISNDVAEATRCTAVDWSGSYGCCTSANPCRFGHGDCDENDDSTCFGDLTCGVNNCLKDFGFGDSSADCCINDAHKVVWFEAYRYISLFSYNLVFKAFLISVKPMLKSYCIPKYIFLLLIVGRAPKLYQAMKPSLITALKVVLAQE